MLLFVIQIVYSRGVAAMAIDLSKAFNRLDHGKLVTILFDLGVPPCALRLLVSDLSGRTMRVHLSDAVSMVYEVGHKVVC